MSTIYTKIKIAKPNFFENINKTEFIHLDSLTNNLNIPAEGLK